MLGIKMLARERLYVGGILAVAVIVLLLLAPAGMAVRPSGTFSPVMDWSHDFGNLQGKLGHVSPAMDANGDGKAELEAEFIDYGDNSYSVAIMNGETGAVMHMHNFTDVGSVFTGDTVSVEPSVYSVTVENASGTPIKEKMVMVFGNHSNNKHISVYSLDYPSLSVIKYRGIDIPNSITYTVSGITVSATVIFYHYSFQVFSNGTDVHILYLGSYVGSISGYYISKLQILDMNETLDTVWEKTEIAPMPGSTDYPIGAGIVSYNGFGFSGKYPSVLFINNTENSGNTTIYAIDAINGNELWNLTLKGWFPIWSPDYATENVYTFDYNRDNRTDFMIPMYVSGENATHANFINASGAILGYYVANSKRIWPSMPADSKVGKFHISVKSEDFNGDGLGDVVMVDNNTKVVCWDVAGNRTVWNVATTNASYWYMAYLSTSDVDGDGVPDIALVGMNESSRNGIEVKNTNITAISGASGSVIYERCYHNLTGGLSGTLFLKEISDFDGDGVQDSAISYEFQNDGPGVHVPVEIISMKDARVIWESNVTTDLNNTDYGNWSVNLSPAGDVDGDGSNDLLVEVYYRDPATGNVTTFIRVLSGADGSVIWGGKIADTMDAKVTSFPAMQPYTSWNQFDYNKDGVINELLVYSSTTVYTFSVTQVVPEMSPVIVLTLSIIALAIAIRRK